jgi:hypothetical protein
MGVKESLPSLKGSDLTEPSEEARLVETLPFLQIVNWNAVFDDVFGLVAGIVDDSPEVKG